MFVTKKHLPRRTFLRGMGVSLALPLLDSMIPARTLLAQTAARPVTRLGFVYFPHGAVMNAWTPATEGAGFEFSPILKPLEPFRNQLNVITGLAHAAADTTAVHSLSPTTWLSGVRPKATQGVDAYAGVTADQIAARAIGQGTILPSLELASEDPSALFGSCDVDYGCIYLNTLSWATPETPLPMETNPRKVFERLFGQGGNAGGAGGALAAGPQPPRRRASRRRQPAAPARAVGPPGDEPVPRQRARDRAPHPARREDAGRAGPGAARTPGRRAVRLRGARQADVRPDDAGVPGRRHARHLVHGVARGHRPYRIRRWACSRATTPSPITRTGPRRSSRTRRIQTYNVGAFAHLLERMRSTPDGDGSLLDHSLLLYGSNMSNSNAHDHFPLPNVVIGGASGRMRGGRHLRYPDRTPMTNLLLSMLDKTGVDLERLGDSTATC